LPNESHDHAKRTFLPLFFRGKIMNAKPISSAHAPAQPEHPAKPQDGSLLLEVVEEQQYVSQQENHVVPGSSQPTTQQAERKHREKH
jgi:hypothetical protein